MTLSPGLWYHKVHQSLTKHASVLLTPDIYRRYQELERPDLHVIAICSPGAIGAVKLTAKSERRVALYCSEDKSLMNKVADWPRSSEAHDVPFLRFGCDRHPYSLADLIVAYLHDCDLAWEIKYIFDEPPITVPSDSRYQAFVSDCVARKR